MLLVGTSEQICGLAQPSPTVVGYGSRGCWELEGEISLDRRIFPTFHFSCGALPYRIDLRGKEISCDEILCHCSEQTPFWCVLQHGRSALPQALHTRISIHTDRRGGCSSSEGNHWARLSCSRRIIGVWARVSVNRRRSRLSSTKEY